MKPVRLVRLAQTHLSTGATALVGALVACSGSGADAGLAPTSTGGHAVSIQAYAGATAAPAGTAAGTLVAGKLVLTAGHICAGKTSWTVTTKDGLAATGVRGMTYDWRDYQSNASQPHRLDICVIELDREIALATYPRIATDRAVDATRLKRVRRGTDGGAFSKTRFEDVDSVVFSAETKGFEHNYATTIDAAERVDTGGALFDPATSTIYGVVSGKGATTGALYVARADALIGAGWVSQHVQHAASGTVSAVPLPPSYCWGAGCANVPVPTSKSDPNGQLLGSGPRYPGAGGGAGGLPGGTMDCYYPAGGGATGVPTATAEYVLEAYNGAQTVHVRLTFNPDFVDNTYGTTAIGWVKKGHTFKDLVGSDHAELALFDKAGSQKVHFKLDYITASATAPSGYATLGVSGGEGKMLVGNASLIAGAMSSLDRNLNQRGRVLLVDSPATNAQYAPHASAPDWDFRVVYEAWVKTEAFGTSGFGTVSMTFVHASPSKAAENTVNVEKGVCPPDWSSGGGTSTGGGVPPGGSVDGGAPPRGGADGGVPPGGTDTGGGCDETAPTCTDNVLDYGDCQCPPSGGSIPR